MINDSTSDLARDDEPIAIEETPEQVEVERKGFSLAKSLRSPRTLISFALAIGIILFLSRGFDIDFARTWEYMRGANVGLLVIGLLVFYLTHHFRGWWRHVAFADLVSLLRSAVVSLVGFWVLGPGVGPPKPGLASVQSWGWGLGLKFSKMAWGIIMLITFSTFVSSSPCSGVTKVNALPAAPMRAVRPTRWT